jgi:hypothetical protein
MVPPGSPLATTVTRGSLLHKYVPSPFERDPNSAVEGRVGVPKVPVEELD